MKSENVVLGFLFYTIKSKRRCAVWRNALNVHLTSTGGSSIIPFFVVVVTVVVVVVVVVTVSPPPVVVVVSVEPVVVVVVPGTSGVAGASPSHAISEIVKAIKKAISKNLVFILLLYLRALKPRQLA